MTGATFRLDLFGWCLTATLAADQPRLELGLYGPGDAAEGESDPAPDLEAGSSLVLEGSDYGFTSPRWSPVKGANPDP